MMSLVAKVLKELNEGAATYIQYDKSESPEEVVDTDLINQIEDITNSDDDQEVLDLQTLVDPQNNPFEQEADTDNV